MSRYDVLTAREAKLHRDTINGLRALFGECKADAFDDGTSDGCRCTSCYSGFLIRSLARTLAEHKLAKRERTRSNRP